MSTADPRASDAVTPRMTDWTNVEAAARAQVAADLDALEQTPLEFGAPIAWARCLYGRTDEFSSVHRVGFPKGNDPFTTCGELIPHFSMWMPLSPNLIRTMPTCRFCAAELSRIEQENAAA